MFVVSMKTTRRQLVAVAVAVLLVLATVLVMGSGQPANIGTVAAVADDAARRAALEGLGYELSPAEAQVREILLPVEADEVFAAYNRLQTEAGYDLSPYQGRRVKCWTYGVTNYPGEQPVRASLYVYKEKIVGGDISSLQQDGFSHGLKPLKAG